MVKDAQTRAEKADGVIPGEPFDQEHIEKRLSGLPLGSIRFFESTGSTNDDALIWLSEGASDGSLIVADEQTSGRGRMKRHWITRKGTALAFSLVFKPELISSLPMYAPLGALGVSIALENLYGAKPEIKWPNDILMNRKKACGILAEASWQDGNLNGVVLGIGINIASSSVRHDDEFLFPAVSLEEALRMPVDRLDLLAEILQMIFIWQGRLDTAEFIEEWNRRLAFRGEMVTINQPGKEPMMATILHIARDGLLWVRRESGEEVPVSAGDIARYENNLKPEC